MSRTASNRQAIRAASLAVVATAFATSLNVQVASAAWIGAVSGTTNDANHSYLSTGNWSTGTVEDALSGTNFSGAVTLYLNNDHNTGLNPTNNPSGNLNTSYAAGGTLTLQSNNSTIRTIMLGGNLIHQPTPGSQLTLASTLAINLGGTRLFQAGSNGSSERAILVAGVISGGALHKGGTGVLQLIANNAYVGETVAGVGATTTGNSGSNRIELSGADGKLASTSITVLPFSQLRLDNASTSPGSGWDRIANAATVSVAAGSLNFNYAASTTAHVHTETIGALQLRPGHSIIQHGVTSASGTNASEMSTTITSLTRNAGSVFLVLPNNGSASNATTNPRLGQSKNTLVIGNAASLLVGGAGDTSTNSKIIPGALGVQDTGTATNLGNINSTRTFLTHDASLGLRPLRVVSADALPSEYAALHSSSSTDNAIITGSTNLSGGPRTVNSLLASAGSTLDL